MPSQQPFKTDPFIFMRSIVMPHPTHQLQGLRRWLLAMVALLLSLAVPAKAQWQTQTFPLHPMEPDLPPCGCYPRLDLLSGG